MAYSWFRVESALVDHPKTGDLEAALKDQNAGWYIIRLFSWVQRYAPHGLIKYARADQIEAAMRWRGRPGELVSTLLSVGWLDDDSQGHFEVHDWDEIQGPLVEKSNNDAEAKRKRRGTKKKNGADSARAGRAPGAKTARAEETREEENRLEEKIDTAPLGSLWNDAKPPECAAVKVPLKGKPQKLATARLKETPDLEVWRGAIQRAHKSRFLRGSKGWRLTFAWLVKPDHLERIVSGEFDDTGPPGSGAAWQQPGATDWNNQPKSFLEGLAGDK